MTVNTPPRFELRPAVLSDASALQQSVWPERTVAAIQELLQRADDITTRGRGQSIVAVNRSESAPESRLIAFGLFTAWPRTSEISELAVAAELRGRGIGTAIIHKLIEAARAFNMPSVEIGVAESNPRALALYRRL